MMSSSSQSFIRNLLVLLALSVWIGTLFIQVEAAPIPVRRSGATGSSGSLPKRSNTPGLGNPFAPYRLIKKRQLAAASSSAAAAAAASTSVLNLATPSQTIASAAAPVASIAPPPPSPLSPLLGAIPPSIASMAAGVLGKLLPSQAAALLPPAGAGAGLVFSSVNIPNSAFAATTTAAVLTTPPAAAAVSVSVSVSISTTTTTVFTTPPPPCSTALAVPPPPVISQPPVAVMSSQVASALPSGTTTFITIGDTPSSVAPLPSGTTTFITINAPPSSVAPLPSGTTTFITVAPPVVTAPPPVASSSSLPSGTTTIITLGAQSGSAGPTLSMTSGAASTSCSSNLVFNKASLHTNPAQNAVFWKAIPDNADAVTALITNPNPPRNEAGDFSAVGAFYVTDTWQAAAQQACYGPAATANGASPVTQVAVIQYQWQPTSNLKIFEFESANTQWNAFIKTKNDPVISTVDLIAGPQTFTKDITTDFWQYALNSDAAMASLELAAVYQPVMCANIPRGNCLPLS